VVIANPRYIASGIRDGADITGADSFGHDQEAMYPVLKAHGTEVSGHGEADSVVIGPDNEHWDAVVLVRYPNRPTFEDMTNCPSPRRSRRIAWQP